jgi:hypothetical protein
MQQSAADESLLHTEWGDLGSPQLLHFYLQLYLFVRGVPFTWDDQAHKFRVRTGGRRFTALEYLLHLQGLATDLTQDGPEIQRALFHGIHHLVPELDFQVFREDERVLGCLVTSRFCPGNLVRSIRESGLLDALGPSEWQEALEHGTPRVVRIDPEEPGWFQAIPLRDGEERISDPSQPVDQADWMPPVCLEVLVLSSAQEAQERGLGVGRRFLHHVFTMTQRPILYRLRRDPETHEFEGKAFQLLKATGFQVCAIQMEWESRRYPVPDGLPLQQSDGDYVLPMIYMVREG